MFASSHCVPLGTGVSAQMPLAGSQMFNAQAVFLPASQVTIDLTSNAHLPV